MKFSNITDGVFFDRLENDSNTKPIDVIMPTLDADYFLEKTLFTIYKEIPVKKLIICDGGSKDDTLKILKKFPRVDIHIKPEIKTGGKYIEFLLSKVETDWFVIVDADRELYPGWFDEMSKHKNKFDVLENSRTILAYHKYIEDLEQLEDNSRSGALCHLARKEAFNNWKCEDDYMWRQVDIMFRYVPEKSGFKYGKIDSTINIHNETDRIPYSSDEEKRYRKLIIPPPKYVIIDKEKEKEINLKTAKGAVKYFDPDYVLIKSKPGFDLIIRDLDREWIKKTNPIWLKKYDKTHSLKFSIKFFIFTFIVSKNEKLLSIIKKIMKV